MMLNEFLVSLYFLLNSATYKSNLVGALGSIKCLLSLAHCTHSSLY